MTNTLSSPDRKPKLLSDTLQQFNIIAASKLPAEVGIDLYCLSTHYLEVRLSFHFWLCDIMERIHLKQPYKTLHSSTNKPDHAFE